MSNKYRIKRIYQFIIGTPLKITSEFFDPEIPRLSPFIDYESYYNKERPTNGLMFDSHQIDFKIRMSGKENTNNCSINITNLSDPLVSELDVNQGNDQVCAFYAGWQHSDGTKELKRIFIGTVSKVSDKWQGQDRQTQIQLTDGGVNVKNAKTARFYPAGTEFDTVVEDMVADLGVEQGSLVKLDGQPLTRRPISYSGNPNDVLNELGRKYRFWFQITNGKGYFVPNDARLSEEAAFISAETGLKGRIEVWDNASQTSKTSTKKEQNGIQFTCQLDGAIIPDYTVVVKDGKFNGAYKVVEVEYVGNFEGNLWDCKVKATLVDKVVKK